MHKYHNTKDHISISCILLRAALHGLMQELYLHGVKSLLMFLLFVICIVGLKSEIRKRR